MLNPIESEVNKSVIDYTASGITRLAAYYSAI